MHQPVPELAMRQLHMLLMGRMPWQMGSWQQDPIRAAMAVMAVSDNTWNVIYQAESVWLTACVR